MAEFSLPANSKVTTGKTFPPPGDAERAAVAAALADGPREEVAADLLWALLNSKEFTFNH